MYREDLIEAILETIGPKKPRKPSFIITPDNPVRNRDPGIVLTPKGKIKNRDPGIVLTPKKKKRKGTAR